VGEVGRLESSPMGSVLRKCNQTRNDESGSFVWIQPSTELFTAREQSWLSRVKQLTASELRLWKSLVSLTESFAVPGGSLTFVHLLAQDMVKFQLLEIGN